MIPLIILFAGTITFTLAVWGAIRHYDARANDDANYERLPKR